MLFAFLDSEIYSGIREKFVKNNPELLAEEEIVIDTVAVSQNIPPGEYEVS